MGKWGLQKFWVRAIVLVTDWRGCNLRERLVRKMLGTNELGRIQRGEQEALQRKQAAFATYMNVSKRLDDTYCLLLSAWEEFEDARDKLQNECDTDVRLILAKKRHKSAQEEFLYQRNERRRARIEFEKAQMEHQQWRAQIRQKLAEGGEGDVCGVNVVATN